MSWKPGWYKRTLRACVHLSRRQGFVEEIEQSISRLVNGGSPCCVGAVIFFRGPLASFLLQNFIDGF